MQSLVVDAASEPNYYKYVAYLDEGIDRQQVKDALRRRGVSPSGEVYASPLHLQPVFAGLHGISIEARSSQNTFALGASLGASLFAGVAGAVSVEVINADTFAHVAGGAEQATAHFGRAGSRGAITRGIAGGTPRGEISQPGTVFTQYLHRGQQSCE